MKIIEYKKKFKQDFIELNKAWIIDNFKFLEKEDIHTFNKIDDNIASGAMIYFAVKDNIVLATCMALPMENNTWEICKLAANKNYKHKGAGSAVFEATMKYAVKNGAKRLFLISNSKLKPALHIYEKYGFKEIKLDNYEYLRGDIAFEYIV